MKNNNMVRTAFSYVLEFRDTKETMKFLYYVSEILVPYSEESMRYRKEEEVFWMKKGVVFWDNNIVKILIRPDDFKAMKGMFTKEHFRRGTNKYVFKGFEGHQ